MFRWLPSLFKWLSEQKTPAPGTELSPYPEYGEGESKPFWDHLEDLRKMLFRMILALFIGFNLCLAFANKLLRALEQPLYQSVPQPERFLQSLNVTDSFVLAMRLAFYGGLVLASPALLYFLLKFILPALRPREKSLLWPVFVLGGVLFALGASLCFFWIVPQTLKAFIRYSEWMRIEPHWTITSYVEFVTQFVLMMGLTFEIPLVLLAMVRLGIVSAETVRKGRRVCIAVAVVVAAIVAPPDPLSMLLMSLPLILLFEITIWIAWAMERRRRRAAPVG